MNKHQIAQHALETNQFPITTFDPTKVEVFISQMKQAEANRIAQAEAIAKSQTGYEFSIATFLSDEAQDYDQAKAQALVTLPAESTDSLITKLIDCMKG